MPRPRRRRRIWFDPEVTYFKPAGIRLMDLKEVNLTREEHEAIRLKDFEHLEQKKAAEKMNISQPTFNRVLNSARKKIAEALVNGKAIRIKGGDFKMAMPRQGMGRGQRRGISGGGRGRMGGFAVGPGGICVCPECGYKESQQRGVPCVSRKCPKCGARMTRG
ncbi:DUF134 domain-containing protein [Candidatus Woesearchaeota archaeon]|nr:DUF134 domain-containing protein [Candidatus Woesearchaeota archaeon]